MSEKESNDRLNELEKELFLFKDLGAKLLNQLDAFGCHDDLCTWLDNNGECTCALAPFRELIEGPKKDKLNEKLFHFLLGDGVDNKERSYYNFLMMNHEEIESTHDIIQWVFPLLEPSRFNHEAPLLNQTTIKTIRASEQCQRNLFFGFVRFEEFLYKFGPGGHYHWLTKNNHNMLRITRVLTSLRLLCVDDSLVENFWTHLARDIYPKYSEIIGETTFEFWKRAAAPGAAKIST